MFRAPLLRGGTLSLSHARSGRGSPGHRVVGLQYRLPEIYFPAITARSIQTACS
jgi:hypothetical protein